MYHKLLLRQIKKYLGEIQDLDEKTKAFLQAVDRTYWHNEQERKLLERSMELSSKELTLANEKLRLEAENQKLILNKLKEALWNLRTEDSDLKKEDAKEEDIITVIDSIRKQIIQKREAKSALKESEEKFRLITTSAQDAIVMIDAEGNVSYWNNAAEKILGYKEDEIRNRNFHQLILPEKYKKDFERGFVRFRDSGTSDYFGKILNLEAIRKDGKKIPVELTISAVKLKNQWHAIGIMRDISDRLRSEKELKNLLKELEEANNEFKNLTYIAAHDLKTPLRGIATLVDWLQMDSEDKFNEEEKEKLRLLKFRVKRMYNLIDSILLYLKVVGSDLKKDEIDIQFLMENLLKEIPQRKNVQIILEKKFPIIRFDRRFIKQVLQNLIINAVEHADENKGVVQIGFEEEKECWKFFVTDNGKGISEKYHAQIFKLFRSLSKKVDKVGLGLPLTKKIVENNGGKIWLESKLNVGTTFYFTVPKS